MKLKDEIENNFVLILIILAIVTLLASCTTDSADTVVRSVNISVAGVYTGVSSNQPFVQKNSGAPVTSFNLIQRGDQLEAIDNNNLTFKGTIGSSSGENSVSFNLEGSTTAGKSVYISGNISVQGSEGTMSATWIEPDFYSTLYGVSTGQSINTNTAGNDRASTTPLSQWTGCCSSHGGIKTNSAGQVLINSSGYARCNDGTSSPDCNEDNR